ncbi:efflux RND transporter periplasmic adaptor subunit [Cytophagaceae bacterium DM2B3-1]|uniref:Efflux RND transporter periplasmic adaptor subunit n=2 Tax=Xanthocytophaga TaxID=3078918 RepID=A0AAE3U7C3_9BACT|nr:MULTISPECIES: efflux RND transporter periplasmic adaptor subunit [Xanthocytophaga]MDJ1473179.1 efflux RND transporter periplasmic adaptor subunit [Xanthocytophaga flavus]MDJ1482251.1 efflux RND transporter periplasmic adaptor subunit [Xanthocytophaga flavus]MDJ1491801.1 efflux RND transporter periplasmic adaptor subunit [Xanthocytophaga flavus]MDJ1502829.1 efflux RND transporter periplasmic adaptor subunit [Xanthocytophaga agilis]
MDRKIEKKKWTPKKIAYIGAASLFGVFAIYSLLFANNKSKLNVESDKITVSTVSKSAFTETIPVTGVVQPLKTIRLDAIEGGYVNRKYMDGGNMVKRGDTILQLQNHRLMMDFVNHETEMYRLINELQNTRLTLKQKRFELRRTLSELDFKIGQAKDLYERNKKLVKDKLISEQDFFKFKNDYDQLVRQREIEIESQEFQEQNAVTQIKQLEGTLARTNRNQKMMQDNLSNLYVKAPVAGQLSTIDVEVGTNINAGQNIGQIDDLNGFKMRAQIDEHYISRIYLGLRGEFDFNGKTHELTISKIFPEVKNGRFEVDMIFTKGAPEGIKRGQSSPVRLELGKAESAILLPTGGFFSTTGGNWVYVLDESGKRATKRNITLGRKSPEYYEVLEGLNVGEKVITSSYENFGDNEVLVLDK